jgi:predicted AAA+ superfamily ATPase
MGLTDKTVRSYLDILSGTFMVRQLQPWHENIGKRQVKSPKIYLMDSGILHALLNIVDNNSLYGHPQVGASWERFALHQFIQILKPSQTYFWSTYSGAELDIFILHRGHRYGAEFKFREAPKISKSMRTALKDLDLQHLWIVYPGHHRYPVDERISVLPLQQLPDLSTEIPMQ